MRSKSSPISAPAASDVRLLFSRLGDIRYRTLNELHLPKRKLRNHSDKQMTKLNASIWEVGFNAPIAITGTGEVICGAARLAAARQLGLMDVPTICLDHLSPAQVRAHRLNESRIAERATRNARELQRNEPADHLKAHQRYQWAWTTRSETRLTLIV